MRNYYELLIMRVEKESGHGSLNDYYPSAHLERLRKPLKIQVKIAGPWDRILDLPNEIWE